MCGVTGGVWFVTVAMCGMVTMAMCGVTGEVWYSDCGNVWCDWWCVVW